MVRSNHPPQSDGDLVKKILGLDLSLNSTGFCILDPTQGTPSHASTIKAPTIEFTKDGIPIEWQKEFGYGRIQWKNKGGPEDRYQKINLIGLVIAELINVGRIDHILLEDYGFARRISGSTIGIAELGAVIRMRLYKGPGFFAVPPATLKKFAANKGNVGKEIILKEIFKRWDFDTDSSDIGDAFALVKMGQALRGEIQITKLQTECLKKVEWWGRRSGWRIS